MGYGKIGKTEHNGDKRNELRGARTTKYEAKLFSKKLRRANDKIVCKGE